MSIIEKPLDTNAFFVGGAGMFIQYHDVIKPAYLYAVMQMIITERDYGLPVGIIKKFSQLSILEWYLNRRYINPLRQFDYRHQIDPNELDQLLKSILASDPSIYKLAPMLSTCKLFDVYRSQHMQFPVYIYSEEIDDGMKQDCDTIFSGIQHKLLSGDLKSAIAKCDQNFTYIFSDIELVKHAADILIGTCSHILLARDYRYNYSSFRMSLRYDLQELAREHPFIRTGTIVAIDPQVMPNMFKSLSQGGD